MASEIPVIPLRDVELAALELKQGTTKLERELLKAVVDARLSGATWEEIGHVLGASRQWAWEKYHYKVGVYLDNVMNNNERANV